MGAYKEHSFCNANFNAQKLRMFKFFNRTPKDIRNTGVHSCYLRVFFSKSDTFSMTFNSSLTFNKICILGAFLRGKNYFMTDKNWRFYAK